MKTLLGTAVVVAGVTFGVSHAFANPAIGCGCTIVLRNGNVATFNGSAVEHIEITYAESGNADASCKVDLGKGTQVTWDAYLLLAVPTRNKHAPHSRCSHRVSLSGTKSNSVEPLMGNQE